MTARIEAACAIAAVAVATAAIWLAAGRDSDHALRAAFAATQNVFAGQEVRVAGVKVGAVAGQDLEAGDVVLRLRIDDESIWPLRQGAKALVRYGRTASTFQRHIELRPGPPNAPPLRNGDLLERSDTVTPVEFDEIFNMVDRRMQRDLQALIGRGARTIGPRPRALARGLEEAPGGVGAAEDLVSALGADPSALNVLVDSGARTTRALARETPEIRELVGSAAATFDELARRSHAITAALDRAPGTLEAAEATLRRTDRSIRGLDSLTADLGPGARGLRGLAPVARRAVAALDSVAPLATSTLRTGAASAPAITRLLRAGTPFVRRLADVTAHAGAQLDCVRPYTPEIAGFLGTWAGFTQNYDSTNHYARVLSQTPPFQNGTPMTSAQILRTYPGQEYAFPRPPGLNAGQTWLHAGCGAGDKALDPRADPEARR